MTSYNAKFELLFTQKFIQTEIKSCWLWRTSHRWWWFLSFI